jgi:hypothetical protein
VRWRPHVPKICTTMTSRRAVRHGRLGVPVGEQPPDRCGFIVSSVQKSDLSARGTALSAPA